MSELKVRIERLEPMRVASLHGFGENPEPQAFDKLTAWARPRGLFENRARHRVFGFNNPNPSPGSPNYGYEVWISIGPEEKGTGRPEIKDFPGGLYAVTRVQGIHNIGHAWQQLAAWCENSKYTCAEHQWLEEHVGPLPAGADEEKIVLDLFLPIAE